MTLLRSTRARVLAVLAVIFALIITLPLSIAFSMLGLESMGVSAKSLRGPVWWGGAEELSIDGVHLGTLNVMLDPFHLFIGQAKVQFVRVNGKPDDLLGALLLGGGARGVERVTGSVPLGATLNPLPLTRATFEDFTARFSGNVCAKAQGRVRVQVAALFGGLNLANGLSGDARCEGASLLLPLASQSGQERLDLRIRANGAYEATMRVHTSDATLSNALVANGFLSSDGEQTLRIAGTL